ECGVWGVIGDGAPIDEFIYNESERIVKAYGNHPSFCMMAYGNEPWGENHTEYLKKFVTHWKNKDARRVYTSGAGWPAIPENDYHNLMEPRIQRWEEGINSVINKEKPETNYDWTDRISSYTKPVVSHEIGQWCVFPDLKEISEYNGVMKARNFEIFRETLENNGMLNLADSFLYASGKLQALCYKSDIEAALRTPGFAGFQLLDLHDFPGQGTALVGILNAFWEKKGYISSDQFKRFCNSSVPLARLDKRVYLNNEEFTARIEMAHFGESVLKDIAPEWKISNDKNEIIFSGKFKTTNIPLGNCFNIGTVTADLSSIIKPCKLTLQVFVDSYSNSWDIWVYPANNDVLNMQKSYRMVTTIDEETGKYLEDGGSVLLTLKKGTLKAEKGGNIVVGFSSIFWNTLWTNGQPPHTLGILCNPKHPIFEEFPTEQYSNWQWWDAMSHSNAIILSSVNPQPEPIVRVIDDWFTNRPLGLIFEAKVGKGKLLVSGIDLSGDLSERPEAGQMLLSISKYISGNHFNPEVEIPLEQVQSLYK
ncbi:MAG TPA: beta-galactosidase, partial [Bacteroidales bacterium]|nr:beta-galactosidase [Bacteroidales bacterium]